jgi:hypothetical protein
MLIRLRSPMTAVRPSITCRGPRAGPRSFVAARLRAGSRSGEHVEKAGAAYRGGCFFGPPALADQTLGNLNTPPSFPLISPAPMRSRQ